MPDCQSFIYSAISPNFIYIAHILLPNFFSGGNGVGVSNVSLHFLSVCVCGDVMFFPCFGGITGIVWFPPTDQTHVFQAG